MTPYGMFSRRAMCLSGAAAAMWASVTQASPVAEIHDGSYQPEILDVWPSRPPGYEKVTVTEQTYEDLNGEKGYQNRLSRHITRPILTVFRPEKPNGSALLIMPGGGYVVVALDVEGYEIAKRWAGVGTTAFVLSYRMPADQWTAGPDAPLQDAQRAIRLMRHNATRFGIDQNRIAVMGFSAGGHLAGSLATRFGASVYSAIDAADQLSARPNLAALIYPVATMMTPPDTFWRQQLLGAGATDEVAAKYSLEVNPPADAPPTILFHAADDKGVPASNSINLFSALQAAGVASELHVFETGGHGFGLRSAQNLNVAHWPMLMDRFAARHGILTPR